LGTLSFTWTANPVKPSFVIKLLSYAKTVKAQLFKLRRKKTFFLEISETMIYGGLNLQKNTFLSDNKRPFVQVQLKPI
jgi:hypothetical protein